MTKYIATLHFLIRVVEYIRIEITIIKNNWKLKEIFFKIRKYIFYYVA